MRSRALSKVSPLLVAMLFVAAVGLLVVRPKGTLLPGLGALALFVLAFVVVEKRLREERPFESHGRSAKWVHPSRNPMARLLDAIANSRLVSAWVEPLPIAPMVSDVAEVIYVSYLVPAERLDPFVPYGLELERLGRDGKWALFSFLTYRHGSFGFRFLGPLRKLFPSPTQTNWRIHVRDPRTKTCGIYFVTNAICRTPPALAARLFTEGMPMHVFDRVSLDREPSTGAIRFDFSPGAGSAPDARGELLPCEAPTFEDEWCECFGSFRGFLEYAVPQNRAMSGQPWHARVTRHEIVLPIDLDACEPLAGTVTSEAVRVWAGDATPVCFRVAGLHFTFEAELHDPVPETDAGNERIRA